VCDGCSLVHIQAVQINSCERILSATSLNIGQKAVLTSFGGLPNLLTYTNKKSVESFATVFAAGSLVAVQLITTILPVD
jgi:hypothetical protein